MDPHLEELIKILQVTIRLDGEPIPSFDYEFTARKAFGSLEKWVVLTLNEDNLTGNNRRLGRIVQDLYRQGVSFPCGGGEWALVSADTESSWDTGFAARKNFLPQEIYRLEFRFCGV